jgi:4-amino-4-deoxy-L-arabinose transferase-like glycosyltransferase
MTHTPDKADAASSVPAWRRWMIKCQAFFVAGLLAVFVVQAAISSWRNSVTVDEFAHLPSGYVYWTKGNFLIYHRNPPLIKMWAALPLFRSHLDKRFTKYNYIWSIAYSFAMENESAYQVLYWRCRMMIVLVAAGLGMLVFRWSRELFGVAGGLLSLAAYVLSPNVIAHASIVSTDLGAAATYTLACYALYKLNEKWSVWRLAFVGVACGIAIITKFSGLALLPLAPLVLVLAAVLRRRDANAAPIGWKKELARGAITLGVIVAASLVIINAGYGFQRTLRPWSVYAKEVEPIGGIGRSFLGPLPAPFPEAFLRGLSEQREASVDEQPFQYLWGKASYEGWWYYYAVAMLFKVPIASLVLLVLAVVAGTARFDRRAFVYVVVPALFFLVVFSLATRINMGIRYVLPVLVLMFVGFGALLRPDAPWFVRRPALVAVPAVLVAWLAVEAAITCPQYLAYFNEFAVGHGERYLIDSNCDCSQDHIRLKRYLDVHGIVRPYLATFGRVDAKFYGIDYKPLPPETPVTGHIFVSINLYTGYPYMTPNYGASAIRVPPDAYAWLHEYTPLGKVGGSLYHFYIPPSEGASAPPDAHDEAP